MNRHEQIPKLLGMVKETLYSEAALGGSMTHSMMAVSTVLVVAVCSFAHHGSTFKEQAHSGSALGCPSAKSNTLVRPYCT